MYWPLYFAPLVLIAEMLHLVIAERYIGVRVLKSGLDPRRGPQPPAWVGWIWFLVSAIAIAYPGLLVFFGSMRLQALLMTLFTVVGFEVRRRSGLKWALVTLTFEGALRIGLIAQMLGLWYVYGSPRLPGLARYWG